MSDDKIKDNIYWSSHGRLGVNSSMDRLHQECSEYREALYAIAATHTSRCTLKELQEAAVDYTNLAREVLEKWKTK